MNDAEHNVILVSRDIYRTDFASPNYNQVFSLFFENSQVRKFQDSTYFSVPKASNLGCGTGVVLLLFIRKQGLLL